MLLSLTAVIVFSAVAPDPVRFPVTAVVVYGDRARVTRATDVAIEGRQRLELPLLPAVADADSVRVELTGPGVLLEAVEVSRLGPADLRLDEARSALAALARVDEELALVAFEDTAVGRAVALARKAPDVAALDDPPGPDGAGIRWRQTLAFLRNWSERTDERRAALADRMVALRAQRSALAEQARRVAAGDEGRVQVAISAAGKGRARVAVGYLVTGASWSPRYELRLLPARDEVMVSLAALVQQRTGEDWIDAALTLSTALPTTSTALPELPRWRIGDPERFVPRTVANAAPTPALSPPRMAGDPARALRARLRDQLLRAAGAAPSPTPPPAPREEKLDVDFVDVLPQATRDVPAGGLGLIVGYVYDQTGSPLKGVRVRGRTAGQRDRSTYSDESGAFRLGGLAEGSYLVEATAPKLKAVRQSNLSVRAGHPQEVNLIMETESSVEEVRVVEKAPVVSTTSASVKQAEGDDFAGEGGGLDSWYRPGSKSAQGAQVVSLAPPPGYRRPALAPDLPAALAGGRHLVFGALAVETVASGASVRRVPLGSWQWPVALERRLVAGVRPEAFVTGALRSSAGSPLPGGEAALWVGGEPVGRARLALLQPGAPVTLPLGMDRAVRAVRQVRVASSEEGLIRKDDLTRYTVTIDVANTHSRPVAAEVVDQVPRGRDDSVEVRLAEGATAGAAIDPGRGTISWRAKLGAGATARFTFGYTLRRKHGHQLRQQEGGGAR